MSNVMDIFWTHKLNMRLRPLTQMSFIKNIWLLTLALDPILSKEHDMKRELRETTEQLGGGVGIKKTEDYMETWILTQR